jgi:hypothetical protein
MILVKVAYDGQSQQFRLLEPDLTQMFDDGETYLIALDIFPTELLDSDRVDVLSAGIGHA